MNLRLKNQELEKENDPFLKTYIMKKIQHFRYYPRLMKSLPWFHLVDFDSSAIFLREIFSRQFSGEKSFRENR